MMQLLWRTLLLTVGAGLLWGFHLYARVLDDAALLVIWTAVSAVIAVGLFRRARLRRRAFLQAYIAADSWLQPLLHGGIMMFLVHLVLAMALATVLLVSLAGDIEARMWWALILAAPALACLHAAIQRGFAAHVAPVYRPEFSLRICIPLLGVPLLAWVLYLALRASYPDFTGVSLERAVWHLAGEERSRSSWLLTALQFVAATDALRLWLAQQLVPALQLPVYQLLAWIMVFVREAVFVWSYLLVCQGFLLGIVSLRAVSPGAHPHVRN